MTSTRANTLSADTLTGREFLRVSHDASGRERSPDEQHKVHARDAKQYGWILHDSPYREVGSASQFRARERKDFPKLISDLNDGRFGANLLILWEGSRGSRDVGEWVTLVTSCKLAGVKIFIQTKDKVFDPANPLDENDLLADAVQSARRAAEISVAVSRATAENLADGKPHGKCPYGFQRIYDRKTGAYVRQEADPEEAEVIREMYRRITKGHALKLIERDFEARGIVNRDGALFTANEIGRLARRPTYKGYRTHAANWRDVRAGKAKAKTELVKAEWDGIVSPAEWQAANNILADPKRVTTRPGRSNHLVSMIARCAVCEETKDDPATDPKTKAKLDGRLAVRYDRHEYGEYWCRAKGHTRIGKPALDGYVEGAILDFISRKDIYDRLVSGQANTAEIDRARDDVASLEAELDQLTAELEAEGVSAVRSVRILAGAEKRLADARRHLAEISTPAPLAGILGGPGDDVRARWRESPMSARRDVARIVLSRGLLGECRIRRVERGGGRSPEDRVIFHKG